MTVTTVQLVCPSCGTSVATVALPGAGDRSRGGPAELAVRAWLADDDWSGLAKASELRGLFASWATENDVEMVSDKAFSMGLLAAGVTRQHFRDGTYFRR